MVLGQAIEAWRPALDTNDRRISGVADPIHRLDAINKQYLEKYLTEIAAFDKFFDIDCLTY
jgi:hypothetical protein